MNNCTMQEIPMARLGETIDELLLKGGRVQMAYAWFPDAQAAPELRYIATILGQREFFGWRVEAGDFAVPSLVGKCPLLGWYEREIMELSGVAFSGHPEPERLVTAFMPSLTRGPLEPGDTLHAGARMNLAAPSLPQVSGKHVQLLPYGPVRADVVESAQFIFYYIGEGILHYHPNLFLKHRGMEKAFERQDIDTAVLFAERVSGVDSVAHALAYSQAVEDASGCVVPQRARWLRVLAAELERLYNHLHYLGHLCHTTTLKVGEAQGKLLEEYGKQINGRASGSRFLRNVVCPGGVRRDLDIFAIADGLASLGPNLERYVQLIERTTSHLDRLISTAPLGQRLAFDQGATGPVERASGVDRDLRRDHPYAAYDELHPTVAVHAGGDAYARMKVRIEEARATLALLDTAISRGAPDGPLREPCAAAPNSEGLGWAESSRGTVLYAIHLDRESRLARVKIKSPSFSNWSVFLSTVHDSNMMDYAINEASFGLTVSDCAR